MARWIDNVCTYCNEKGLPACICGFTVTVWDSIVGERKLEFEFSTFTDAKRRIDEFLKQYVGGTPEP